MTTRRVRVEIRLIKGTKTGRAINRKYLHRLHGPIVATTRATVTTKVTG